MKIEWTDKTWNPVTGCTPISDGCKNCYAAKMAKRLQGMGAEGYEQGFKPQFHLKRLDIPAKWRKPSKIFVCSMGDLFHEDISDKDIMLTFRAMWESPLHQFQLLTKRPARALELQEKYEELTSWPLNIWFGTTIENKKALNERLPILKRVRAFHKFLSCEPLLEELGNVYYLATEVFNHVDWVILGGENGLGARPMKKEWARQIMFGCVWAKVPFFFKGWGGVRRAPDNELLDGEAYKNFPASLC